MSKYYCLNPIAKIGLDKFNDNFEKTEDMNEADAILVRSADMHSTKLSDSVLAVARAGAGVNNIPLEEYGKEGVIVFNTPGANANGVKELVFAGMLLASRDITGGIKWVRENAEESDIAKMAEKQKKAYAGTELSGKKLGVIGLGAIGVLVANAATHMGMEVIGYDPFISVKAAWNLSRSVKHANSVDEVYAECDFITIHVPLLDSTKEMIDKYAITKMKDGVIILNFARDLLVDEAAVLGAIGTGKVRKYVSDFPNPTTAGKDGVILIPHLGASTEESEDNCAVMAVDEVVDYIENGNIRNSVNYPNCDMGICEAPGRIAILHNNVKGVVGKVASIIGDSDINLSDMTNKTKGQFGYSLIDLDSPVTEELVRKFDAIDDIIRVRVIK